jgi:hypothetical protein
MKSKERTMHLYKSSRTIISATSPIDATEVYKRESGEAYLGEWRGWILITGDVNFTFHKNELVPIPNTALVMDNGHSLLASDDADNWAEFWPAQTVSFED